MSRPLTGIKVIRHIQKELRGLWQIVHKELNVCEDIATPPFPWHMRLLEQNLKHLGSHFLSFYLVRHNNHEIGQIELIFRVLNKELDSNIIREIFVLHIVLNQGIVGEGHFGLIRTIVPNKAEDTFNPGLIILVAFYEPRKSLLCLPLLFMDCKQFNTGIVLFLMPVLQRQNLLIELNGLVLMGAGGVVAVGTVIGISHMNAVFGFQGFIKGLLENLPVL
jgi:hypothetical protein